MSVQPVLMSFAGDEVYGDDVLLGRSLFKRFIAAKNMVAR